MRVRKRRLARGVAVATVTGLLAGLPLWSGPLSASARAASALSTQSAVSSPGTAGSEAVASSRAAASGEPVEVTDARSEYTTTLANPDGTFTLTQSTQPQRAKGADGAWHAIDTTLEKRSDGTVGPRSAVADLSFSGGGAGSSLIRLGRSADQELRLGWPSALPTPTLDGATATYADVPVKGVNLQLTATADGYHEVLVVTSAQAAASSALEEVKLTARGEGLSVIPGEGGGVRAVDADGNAVFRGPAGMMWDSAGDAPAGARTQLMRTAQATGTAGDADGDAQGGDDSPVQPGEGDTSAELPVQVDEGSVSVAPDLDLLRGADTVYPVYIDPSVGLGLSEWTKLSSDGDKFWKFTDPKGVGRCGVADGYACSTGGYTDRMYFEFGPGELAGKYVLDATFRAYETWSFNCTPYWVDLERTDNISEGTRWPGPKQLDQMGDRYVSAGRGDLCSPDQPNSWIEFNDNPDEPDENLTSTVRSFAAGSFPRLTLMLRAKDEGEPRAWKRFDNNAELKVNYMHKPGVPTSVGVIPGTGTKTECKSSSEPTTVTTITPTVRASVQTLVELHQGDEEGSLQAEFYMERSSDDTTKGTWNKVWSDYLPKPGWVPDGTVLSLKTDNRADGGLYRFKARTQSHGVYGAKDYDLFSPYSSWCYLRVDSTAPKAPTITSGGPYTACTSNDCAPQGGPGVPGTFTFKPNSADSDVKAYRWRLLTSDAADTKEVKPATTNGPITIKDVTPGLSGTQTLSVEASDLKLDKDGRTRWGNPAQFDFKVALADGPTGRWKFDDGAAGSGVMTAKDTGEVGTRHDAVLRDEAGTGWSTLGRRGAGDYSLRLNDNLSDPATGVGYASTDGPAVNTHDSFTVSAWTYLTDDGANHTVLSAPGEYGSAFTLYYSAAYKKWVFNRTAKDPDPAKGESAVYIRSMADAASPPLRVWTHLTGVFDTNGNTDPKDDTIQLFVNGRAQGKPVVLATASSAYTPWTADRNLMIGRSKTLQGSTGTYGEYFTGRVDEVATWQQVLPDKAIRLEGKLEKDGVPANELVAHWDPTISSGTQVAESPEDPDDPASTSFPYHRGSLALSATGASLSGEDATSLVLNGSTGSASVAGPVVDETNSFTVSTRVRLNKTALAAKPVGDKFIIAAQANPGGKSSSWALWVSKLAADTYEWRFGRTAVSADGATTLDSAQVFSEPVDPNSLDTWVDVTGVFDATADFTDNSGTQQFGKVRLYVGPIEQNDQDSAGLATPQQGTGVLTVGRGSLGGVTGRYLPGDLAKIRIWVGAMTPDQISSQVTETTR
ncbi:LamG-like jellyroll fold domain-containing protein [Streptomyces sp. cg28]|uniref:LamG-like jellyroll fold domain-containing protein n=1 Tax=Streptomyces sp. cg28 TaxID=3403457 RepID=UPI003B22631A